MEENPDHAHFLAEKCGIQKLLANYLVRANWCI